jgi:LPXTG-motif cell wall-anchored protein
LSAWCAPARCEPGAHDIAAAIFEADVDLAARDRRKPREKQGARPVCVLLSGQAMSKRRSALFTLAVVLPAALVLSIAPARAQETPVEVAATDGGADTGGDMGTTDTSGATDAATTDGPRDTAGSDTAGSDAAGNDAPRTDGGTNPTDDEGDCGCRLGSTGRSSAALPLAGALAGLGLVIRRRRRR